MAIAVGDRERAANLVNERLVTRAVGQHIDFAFTQSETDDDLLRKVALAYELAAIEGLEELSRTTNPNATLSNQSAAAAHCAFDVRRLLVVPEPTLDRIFHVLHLSALAYCGDRWSDLRRWYREHDNILSVPSLEEVPWDRRLLYRLFDCWARLFRKDGWGDLDQVRVIVAGLREDQKAFESGLLNDTSPNEGRTQLALRLVSLYHWAKGTEVLAEYMLQGTPPNIYTLLDKHFEAAIQGATGSTDAQLEIILRWLHAAGHVMVSGSVWWATRTVNSRVSDFVRSITKREHQALFELLPPQRAALLEQGLLDQAKTAVVIDMPTSGGKTLLAQFRILQALNQFSADNGWVAYIAPTRALSAQITRRLRRDFEPIGVSVEQLTGAIEVDAFEEQLLLETKQPFGVLVATPEKLAFVIRNKKIQRPLALVVMDEAHNLETESRGLRIELLLATVKRDCPTANFLLLMPYVEKAETLARWLAQDVNAGNTISFASTAWKPNERIIGIYRAVPDDSVKAGWHLQFETLTTSEKALKLKGNHRVGGVKPFPLPKSDVLGKGTKQKSLGIQTAAMATILSERGTSIAVGNTIEGAWSMARHAAATLPEYPILPPEVRLVQDFIRTEVGHDFELVKMLDHGVGVHHAGLSDEIRTLIEWLAECGTLRVLCATSTVAQGINFPVSSIFLTSRFVPQGHQSVEMSPREFWNLAGRAGRMNHDSVGVIGMAEGQSRSDLIAYVSRATGALASRLVVLMDELEVAGRLHDLSTVILSEKWEDFRCYVAHLWAEKKNLDAVLAESEQLLRQTYGYGILRDSPATREKADILLKATQAYARSLAQNPGAAELADATGFSPEGVRSALAGLGNLEQKLTASDWAPESLFGDAGSMANLFGVMLRIPQLSKSLKDAGGKGITHMQLANITKAWVEGAPIQDIARTFFAEGATDTQAFTAACRAIYRSIVNSGTWGISALSRVSGIDFDSLSDQERRNINTLPAMIYHGVRTEEAVLMRMNAAPRSAAENIAQLFREMYGNQEGEYSLGQARQFLRGMTDATWDKVRPPEAALSGPEYKRVWEVLSGEPN
jgi:hypothetical protein